jgi:hypothetical protein
MPIPQEVLDRRERLKGPKKFGFLWGDDDNTMDVTGEKELN